MGKIKEKLAWLKSKYKQIRYDTPQYAILANIDRANGPIEYMSLLSRCSVNDMHTLEILKEMRKEQLVSGSLVANSFVKLTPAGREHLLEMRKQMLKSAYQSQRHSKKKEYLKLLGEALFNTAVAVLSTLLFLHTQGRI